MRSWFGLAATPLCAATPVSGCRTSAKGLLLLKKAPIDTSNSLTWKWTQGAGTARVEFGSPVLGTTTYALCVYDASSMLVSQTRAA